MPTIDADARVIESEETWSYIRDEKFRAQLARLRPQRYVVGNLALRTLKEKGEVELRIIDKILYDNAKALYGL